MMRRPNAVAIRLCTLLAIAACTMASTCPLQVQVNEPAWGSASVRMPIDFEIRLIAGYDPGSFEVRLNGTDITAAFVLGPVEKGRLLARSDDFWDDALLLPGTNSLSAFVAFGGQVTGWTTPFDLAGDPYADAIASFVPGAGAGFGQNLLPDVVLGAPKGEGAFEGSLDVLSLGAGGVLTLEFVDNAIVDGPGDDFAVFENAFLQRFAGFSADPFAEPGRVSVSQDGVAWFVFAACQTAPLAPPFHPGCAGVYPTFANDDDPTAPHASIATTTPIADLVGVSLAVFADPAGAGGDRFDLAELGLAWARFVRIEDVGPALGQTGTIGLDIDAVAAIHAVPGTDENSNGIPDALE